MHPRGKFITLEGGDGCGKSTQTKVLVEALRGQGISVVQTREIGGSDGAEAIRNLWLSGDEYNWDEITELLLIFAARRDHLAKTIHPALARGDWVVSDRFVDSSRVYQGIGLGLGREKVDMLYRLIADDFVPDLTLLLDVDVTTGAARMKDRNLDRYEQRDQAFHQKLRDGYLALAEAEPARFAVIDAGQDVEAVTQDVLAAVRKKFS